MNNWLTANPDPITEGQAPEGEFEKYDGISVAIFPAVVPPLFSISLIIKKWSFGIKWCFNGIYRGWSIGKVVPVEENGTP